MPSAGRADREIWMDVLRGEMMVLIIVFHSTGLLRYAKVTAPQRAVDFNNLSEPYWMPTFSFLSGMLVDASMNKTAGEYYAGKVRSGLYPFATWTVINAAVFKEPLTGKSILRLGTGGTYLFFLGSVFAFNALSYPIRHLPPGIVAATSLAVGGAAPARLPGVPDRFTQRFWYLLAMFMLGREAGQRPAAWRKAQQSRTALSLGAVALIAGSLAASRRTQVSYRWQWAWSPALAMIPLARAASAIGDHPASQPLAFIGRNSVVYYTAHYPVAYGVARWCHSRGERSGSRALAATLVASAGVSTALVWARRRSPLVARLFAI
jgi:fucose 4-O-acetylase-like acetyltransferase